MPLRKSHQQGLVPSARVAGQPGGLPAAPRVCSTPHPAALEPPCPLLLDRQTHSLPPACHPQEDYRPQIEEMSFLQDVERNDGRLMLFQLPALLPVAQQVRLPVRAECCRL